MWYEHMGPVEAKRGGGRLSWEGRWGKMDFVLGLFQSKDRADGVPSPTYQLLYICCKWPQPHISVGEVATGGNCDIYSKSCGKSERTKTKMVGDMWTWEIDMEQYYNSEDVEICGDQSDQDWWGMVAQMEKVRIFVVWGLIGSIFNTLGLLEAYMWYESVVDRI